LTVILCFSSVFPHEFHDCTFEGSQCHVYEHCGVCGMTPCSLAQNSRRFVTTWCLHLYGTMEAAGNSENQANFHQTTRRQIPKHSVLQSNNSSHTNPHHVLYTSSVARMARSTLHCFATKLKPLAVIPTALPVHSSKLLRR